MDAAFELFPISYNAVVQHVASRIWRDHSRACYLEAANEAIWCYEVSSSNQRPYLLNAWNQRLEKTDNKHWVLAFKHAVEILEGLDKRFITGGSGTGTYPLQLKWGKK